MMKRYTLAIFDLDGTLIKSKKKMKQFDMQAISDVRGYPVTEEEYMSKHPVRTWEEFFTSFGIDHIQAIDRFYEHEARSSFEAIEGAGDMLEYIVQKNVPRYLLTYNRNIDVVYNKVKSAGLEEYFGKNIYVSGPDKTRELIDICSKEKTGIPETLFITDTCSDIRSAIKVNIDTVAISGEESFNSYQELAAAKPTYLAADIREIKKFF